METNLLGQIAQYSRSNSDQAFKFDGYLTNLAALSNLTASAQATNIVSLSNYNLETTQRGISNLLADIDTNLFSGVGNTNLDSDLFTNDPSIQGALMQVGVTNFAWVVDGSTNLTDADTATTGPVSTLETSLMSWIDSFVDPSGGEQDYYPAVDMTYTFIY